MNRPIIFSDGDVCPTEKGLDVKIYEFHAGFEDRTSKFYWDKFGRPISDNTAHEYGALIGVNDKI